MSSYSSSLNGTVIVTGANGGLGSATVTELLKRKTPSYGVYTVRNPSSSRVSGLKSLISGKKDNEIAALDLDSLDNVREFARDINARVAAGIIPKVKCLILNAGYQDVAKMTLSKDGYEKTFQANYLSNYLLVLLLLQSMDMESGRIIPIASWTHDPTFYMNQDFKPEIPFWKDPKVFANPPIDNKGDEANAGMRRYGGSKTLIVMFMHELQRRLNNDPRLNSISILAVDPKAMATGILRSRSWLVNNLLLLFITIAASTSYFFGYSSLFTTTTMSAKDTVFASFDEDTLGKHPKAIYLFGREKKESYEECKDEAKGKELWEKSAEMVHLKESDTVLKQWY